MGAYVSSILPDEVEVLGRLRLNATDAARVCGVTVRQLTYWTDKGIVRSSGDGGRSYDVAALRKAMSIKRLMLNGYTLDKAAQVLAVGPKQAAGAPIAGGAQSGASRVDEALASVEEFKRRLPAYFALARLKRTVAGVDSLGLSDLFGEGAEDSGEAQRVAARLSSAAEEVDRALRDVVGSANVAGNRVTSAVPEASWVLS